MPTVPMRVIAGSESVIAVAGITSVRVLPAEPLVEEAAFESLHLGQETGRFLGFEALTETSGIVGKSGAVLRAIRQHECYV